MATPPLPASIATPAPNPVLAAAFGVFARFGYRKTSMDDVARAAGVSRQGLYLHFSNKEELFRRAVEECLALQLRAVSARLEDASAPLSQRLVDSLWMWCFGSNAAVISRMLSAHSDLTVALATLAGATVAAYEAQFEAAMASALSAVERSDDARAVAHSLHATARGLVSFDSGADHFLEHMRVATRLCCGNLVTPA